MAIKVSDLSTPSGKPYNYKGSSSSVGPCLICGQDVKDGSKHYEAYMHDGGALLVTSAEYGAGVTTDGEALEPGGAMGCQPIGLACYKHNAAKLAGYVVAVNGAPEPKVAKSTPVADAMACDTCGAPLTINQFARSATCAACQRPPTQAGETTMRHYAANGHAGCVKQVRSRATGTLVGLYVASQAALDEDGGPWVTVCETHGTICNHLTRKLAEHHIPSVSWCEQCQTYLESERAADAADTLDEARGHGEAAIREAIERIKALYNRSYPECTRDHLCSCPNCSGEAGAAYAEAMAYAASTPASGIERVYTCDGCGAVVASICQYCDQCPRCCAEWGSCYGPAPEVRS
jgi:hypothetical protein